MRRATYAGVVELADARDSKSRVRKDVRVRPPPPAPKAAQNEPLFSWWGENPARGATQIFKLYVAFCAEVKFCPTG